MTAGTRNQGKWVRHLTAWAPWEHVYWIKRGIEKSGWQGKEDNLKFIEALEGMSVAAGPDFITRGQDDARPGSPGLYRPVPS